MKTMDDLREVLFGTIADLREGKADTATAKTVAELGQIIINTAKAEADYARATGRTVVSALMNQPDDAPPTLPPATGNPIADHVARTTTGTKSVAGAVTSHRLK